jgi:cytochrome c-type biogenesis protein CcmH/NrfG
VTVSDDDDGPVGAWQIDDETRRRLRLQHLRAAARDEKWVEVELEAEELLDEDPSHPEALFLLGEASLSLGHHEVARLAYGSALRADPGGERVETPAALTGLALACFHVAAVPEAVEAARDAVRIDPERAEAHHVLSMALDFVPGRSAEALSARMAAARLDPDRFPLPAVGRGTTWEEVIGEALARTPPWVRSFYASVPFRIEELPGLEEVRAHAPPISPAVVALTDGVPPAPDEPADRLPTGVRVFWRNLERAGTVGAMVRALADDLEDEAGLWTQPEGEEE